MAEIPESLLRRSAEAKAKAAADAKKRADAERALPVVRHTV